MLTVVFVLSDGRRMMCPAHVGETVMDVALDNGVPGVSARCGGAGHCTTCHCFVDPAWVSQLAPEGADEREMLGGLRDRRPGSRLTCQIELTEALDGIELRVP